MKIRQKEGEPVDKGFWEGACCHPPLPTPQRTSALPPAALLVGKGPPAPLLFGRPTLGSFRLIE